MSLNLDLKNFWLIDPIDGTRDYINNILILEEHIFILRNIIKILK